MDLEGYIQTSSPRMRIIGKYESTFHNDWRDEYRPSVYKYSRSMLRDGLADYIIPMLQSQRRFMEKHDFDSGFSTDNTALFRRNIWSGAAWMEVTEDTFPSTEFGIRDALVSWVSIESDPYKTRFTQWLGAIEYHGPIAPLAGLGRVYSARVLLDPCEMINSSIDLFGWAYRRISDVLAERLINEPGHRHLLRIAHHVDPSTDAICVNGWIWDIDGNLETGPPEPLIEAGPPRKPSLPGSLIEDKTPEKEQLGKVGYLIASR